MSTRKPQRPLNVRMASGISDADWDAAVNATETMSGWLDWTLGLLPPVAHQLWLARTYAYARGMQDERSKGEARDLK